MLSIELISARETSLSALTLGLHPVRRIKLTNEGYLPLQGLTLTIRTSPAILPEESHTIQTLSPHESVVITPKRVGDILPYLAKLTQEEKGVCAVGIRQGDQVLAAEERGIRLLPVSYYLGEALPLTLATHVDPAHAYATRLIRHAGAYLHRTHRRLTLSGYAHNREGVREQVYALYEALREEKLSVSETPITQGVTIQSLDRLKEEGAGSTLDIALLFASAIEKLGLNPILILTEHHADVGVWLTHRTFAEAVVEDPRQITLRAAEGVEELCLIDPSLALSGTRPEATSAHVLSRLSQKGESLTAIDIYRAREGGIYPLPHLSKEGELIPYLYEDSHTLTASPEAEEAQERPLTPYEVWERQLLDLTLRNTLISLNPTTQSVPLIAPSIGELIALTNRGGELALLPHPAEMADDASPFDITAGVGTAILRGEASQGRLRSSLPEKELNERLSRLYRQTRTQLEESGASPLFLALGLVKWCEDDKGEREHYAPLVLLPATLKKKRSPLGYTFSLREEEPCINIALLNYLKINYDIAIPLGDTIPRGDTGLNLALIFNAVRRAIMEREGWEVIENASLTVVSFGRFILWNDLKNREDKIRQNPLVSALIQGSADGIPAVRFPTPRELDTLPNPAVIPVPLPADSSQLSAIAAASCGASFVLHGPPGTGKSQTITNMIAACLASGRKVLFVAEKAAALSVVQKRLEDLGLSPFCLEIHSEKTKKATILSKLSATLSAREEEETSSLKEVAERLAKERDALGRVLHDLHRPHPSGLSLYDAIVGHLTYEEAKALPLLTPEMVKALTPDTYGEYLEAVRDCAAAAMGASVCRTHPLAFYQKRSATPDDKETLTGTLREYLACASHFESQSLAVGHLLPLASLRAYEECRALRDLLSYLTNINVLPDGLLTAPTLLGMGDKVERLTKLGAQREAIKEAILNRFDRTLLLADAETPLREAKEAELASPLLRPAKRKRERVKLAVYAKDPTSVQNTDVIAVWEAVLAYQRLAEELLDACRSCAPLFGPLLHGADTDTAYIGRIYDSAVNIKRLAGLVVTREEDLMPLLSALDKLASTGGLLTHANTFRTYIASFDHLGEAEEKVAQAAGADVHRLRTVTHWPDSETVAMHRALDATSGLRDYVIYLAKKDRLSALGLSPLTDALESGTLNGEDLLPVFFRNSCLAIAEDALASSPALATFSHGVAEERLRALYEAEGAYRTVTARHIRATLMAGLPSPEEGREIATEIATLGRAIRTASRGLSIRRLFESIPNLLGRLAPCMLMSPLSAAQYLSEGHTFDLVIFDEASQLPTCEAVGAISRGKSVVVVGDPNQLPPTSFFQSARQGEEFESLPESLLDDCLALGMPEQHLLWHYRSRHESLIAYSNRTYYDNALHTFPSPNAPVSRVSLRECGGVYDRGGKKQNRLEAEMVVDEMIRRLEAGEQKSLGVVTFSQPQQTLIEDLIEERIGTSPDLAQKLDALPESLFIKNLENVQGDERDVILFSICYGPDKEGRVSLNFGPLNREGGWRRLNVAVSRAREEMVVFSSLSPNQIDLSRTTAQGVIGLRGFLEYAKYGKAPMSLTAKACTQEVSLADRVAKDLTARGWLAHTHVGVSRSRVDVAVAHPDAPDTYLLGILTDEKDGGSITDRYLIREEVFRRLGWQLYHLWSVEYRDAPERVLDRIEALLKKAHQTRKAKSPVAKPVKESPVAPKPEIKLPMPTPAPRGYSCPAVKDGYFVTRLAPIPEEMRNTQAFFAPEHRERLLFAIREILVKEAPISHRLLSQRILEAWGIRATARTDSYLHTLVGETVCTPRVRDGVRFYWALGQEPQEYNTFRIPLSPKERRESGDIPCEEVSAAVTYLAASRGSLSREEAIREVAKVFGYTRLSPALTEKMESGIALAIKRKEIVHRGDRLLSATILT